MRDADDGLSLEGIDKDLLQLARSPEDATAYRLWTSLTDNERATAVEAVLTEGVRERSGLYADLVTLLADTFNLRQKTLESWPAERVAREYGRALRPRNPALLRALLRALHLADRRPLLIAFLDSLGVPHTRGLANEEDAPHRYPKSAVASAAAEIWRSHSPRKALVYLLTLVILEDRSRAGLIPWLPSTVPEGDSKPDSRPPTSELEPEATTSTHPVDVESTDRFTTIDRIFVRAIADSSQGVEGALTRDQLEDAVEELVDLNSHRHRSYFHLGFMDSELGRDARSELRAQNADRLRWYWAGYITGLARKARHEEIASLFDNTSAVRELGTGGQGPSHAAARLVFESLCRCDRPGEAARFLDSGAVLNNLHLFRSLLNEGTLLLHNARPSDARPIFVLLGSVIDVLRNQGLAVDHPLILEARRRRAHCFRQLGEVETAAEILRGLVQVERDPEIRAMVHADLGLIDGDFTRLADLRIPDDAERQDDFRTRLERGEQRFRQAVSAAAQYSAHGHYCLGVLSLLRDDHPASVQHLDRALSEFEAEPDRYRHGGLLDNARVYLGIAISLSLDDGRVERASRLIRVGIDGDSRMPRRHLEDVLEGLHIRAPDRARAVAEAVLKGAGEDALDIVGNTSAGLESSAVADALLARGRRSDRADSTRAADLRRSLPALLAQQRSEEAAATLDDLEGLARRGVDTHEYLQVVADPDQYQPAWEVEDARWSRVICLESSGRLDQAAAELRDHFHQVISAGRYGAFEEGEGIIDRIRSYGLEGDGPVPELESRLEAVGEESATVSDEETEALRPVRVFFVGGDERQVEQARRVEEELAESHPRISVSFLHPGWGSNWSHDLEEATRSVDGHDAVVIMRYIRTEFGRQLRKSLGSTPWVACTTAGIRSMRASILRSAELGRRSLEKQDREIRAGTGNNR